MASNQNTGKGLYANVARITADPSKVIVKDGLPPDMQSDLRDSFEFFAKDETLISRGDFESIIHNFGFNRVANQREKETEL